MKEGLLVLAQVVPECIAMAAGSHAEPGVCCAHRRLGTRKPDI